GSVRPAAKARPRPRTVLSSKSVCLNSEEKVTIDLGRYCATLGMGMPFVILNVLLPIHVLAGATALCSFWLPLVTIKGGKAHRRAGRVFVAAMALAALTAWMICGIRFTETEDVHQRAAAAFLAYVGLLAMNTSWSGLRVLRFKNRTGRHRHPVDIGMPL